MTVSVIKMFDPIVIGTTQTVLYTMPNAPASVVLGQGRIRFTNISASSQQVTAYDIPSGQSATSDNTNLAQVTINGNSYLDVDMPNLGPSGSYAALASSSNSIVAHALGGVLFS